MTSAISNRDTATRRVVVVTGASSGVGRAVARAFGATRARVALLARNVDALNACAREIERGGGEALVYSVDALSVDANDVDTASDTGGALNDGSTRARFCRTNEHISGA